jgi:VanZ family protein
VTREPAGAASTRPARLLLLAYAAFVVYGSFFPFQFRIDLEGVQRDLARFWGTRALFDARGRRLFSIADLVSNLLLGAPVGVLLVRGRLVGRGVLSRVAGVLTIEAVFAGLVEVGQILAPGRTASVVDVLAQMAGALGGALAVHALGADAARRSAARLAALARQRPALLMVALVAALLAADALYPYAVTLDVSTAWDNLKRAQRQAFTSLGRRGWADLLVERALPNAALVMGVRLALGDSAVGATGARTTARAWLLCTAWAAALEGAKLFIVGRAPSVDNVILAALGGSVGALAFAPLAGTLEARARGPALLAWLTGAHLVYRELAPFDWLGSTDQVAAKASRIEWVPLASYLHADPQSALLDLCGKLVWSGLFGAALRAAGARAPWAWGVGLAAAPEGLQVLQRSHVPALTDVFTLGMGAALGAAALGRYRRWRGATAVSITGH